MRILAIMNTTTKPTVDPAALRNGRFEALATPMQEVETLLRSELSSRVPFVDELLNYVAEMGGKRLRPALMLLAAQSTGTVKPAHILLGTVVEMIHIATLIHDDILDDADVRRHRPTVNRRWNNESSVLLGDYLFTHSFYLASTMETTHACQVIGRATNRVCEGELRQVGNRGNLELTEAEYFEIVTAKTAELCACATQLGARYAGATDRQCEQLEEYGRQLGVAFQVADDVLDLTGDESHMGKSLGTDLEKQKLTLPVIHLLKHAEKADRREALEILSEPVTETSRQRLQQYLSQYGSIDYAREKALRSANNAIDQICGLPESDAKETLTLLANFAIERNH